MAPGGGGGAESDFAGGLRGWIGTLGQKQIYLIFSVCIKKEVPGIR